MKMQYNKFWVGWNFGAGLTFLAIGWIWFGLIMAGLGFLQSWLEAKKDQRKVK